MIADPEINLCSHNGLDMFCIIYEERVGHIIAGLLDQDQWFVYKYLSYTEFRDELDRDLSALIHAHLNGKG